MLSRIRRFENFKATRRGPKTETNSKPQGHTGPQLKQGRIGQRAWSEDVINSELLFPTSLPSHDDVIKWKPFPRYCPFVQEIHRSPANSPHKGQWCEALIVFFDLFLNKRLSKQSWGWWFETLSRSLRRHCNASRGLQYIITCFICCRGCARSRVASWSHSIE